MNWNCACLVRFSPHMYTLWGGNCIRDSSIFYPIVLGSSIYLLLEQRLRNPGNHYWSAWCNRGYVSVLVVVVLYDRLVVSNRDTYVFLVSFLRKWKTGFYLSEDKLNTMAHVSTSGLGSPGLLHSLTEFCRRNLNELSSLHCCLIVCLYCL